jgi:hypothetical protein
MAYRTSQTIHFDPKERRILNQPEAEALWERDYQEGWKPLI